MFFYNEMTRFERTRIISARALQISMGAPVLIRTSHYDPMEIARMEFEKGVLPITVKRSLPRKLK
ncbi:MAG: DNA-directed RNA polymerase subunit K [Candidatus Aenigmarchaeota archaeon]|nr:DNA-directed RNA polymerase subunit K [Candidatus Aenigmarchaeota archaeon]